jgi:hypothetical protein
MAATGAEAAPGARSAPQFSQKRPDGGGAEAGSDADVLAVAGAASKLGPTALAATGSGPGAVGGGGGVARGASSVWGAFGMLGISLESVLMPPASCTVRHAPTPMTTARTAPM